MTRKIYLIAPNNKGRLFHSKYQKSE